MSSVTFEELCPFCSWWSWPEMNGKNIIQRQIILFRGAICRERTIESLVDQMPDDEVEVLCFNIRNSRICRAVRDRLGEVYWRVTKIYNHFAWRSLQSTANWLIRYLRVNGEDEEINVNWALHYESGENNRWVKWHGIGLLRWVIYSLTAFHLCFPPKFSYKSHSCVAVERGISASVHRWLLFEFPNFAVESSLTGIQTLSNCIYKVIYFAIHMSVCMLICRGIQNRSSVKKITCWICMWKRWLEDVSFRWGQAGRFLIRKRTQSEFELNCSD